MFIIRFFSRGRQHLDDTRFKSSLMTISWRLLASLDALMTAWLLTRNLKPAESITSHQQLLTRFL